MKSVLKPGLLLATLLLVSSLLRAEPDLQAFSIQSQALDKALFEFSRQSKLQVFFASKLTEHIRTSALEGEYLPAEALQILLVDTGLEYRFSDLHTIVLYRVDATEIVESFVLPQEEVFVIGSYIRRDKQLHSLSPITTIEYSDILAQGNVELPELLNNLPFSSGAEVQVNNLDQPLTAGTGAINLRNLGLSATMVLLDGFRQTNAAVATTEGETFVDLNTLLPVIMIDRIEVLRDGASATYGSDAVAGVINIIPRHEFRGLLLEGRYQATGKSDQMDGRVSALYGIELGDGAAHFVTSMSYLQRERLATSDRSFTDHTVISSLGQPGTYLGDSGFTRDPQCGIGGGSVSLESEFCQFDASQYFDLIPEEERWQWYSHLKYRLAENSQLDASFSWNKTDVWVMASPSFPFSISLPTVPVDNPGNIFGEPVLFYGRVRGEDFGASRSQSRYQHGFLSLGIITDFEDFSLTSKFSYSRNTVRYGRVDTVGERLQAALNGEAEGFGGQFWNPLYQAENNTELESSFFQDWGMHGKTELFTADMIASTDWFELGAYQYAFALGASIRTETLSNSFAQVYNDRQLLALGGGPDFSSRRNIAAGFGELHLILKEGLELQFAARYENYAREVDALSPKVALRWQLAPHSSIRASYSRAFRAPSLYQVSASQSVPLAISDDLIPGTPIFTNVITVGSSELDPERAGVFNVGMTMGEFEDIKLNVDIWYYDYQDIILKESAQEILERAEEGESEALAKVIRNPQSGRIIQINADFINAASVETGGIDMDLHYEWELGRSVMVAGTAWTWTHRFDISEKHGSPVYDGVGRRNVTTPAARTLPEWKGNAWLKWSKNSYQADLRLNYIDGYSDDGNNDAKVNSYTTLDLNFRINAPLGFKGSVFTMGLLNIFDEPPPFDDTFLGYDAKTHDPRGRLWYLQLGYKFCCVE